MLLLRTSYIPAPPLSETRAWATCLVRVVRGIVMSNQEMIMHPPEARRQVKCFRKLFTQLLLHVQTRKEATSKAIVHETSYYYRDGEIVLHSIRPKIGNFWRVVVGSMVYTRDLSPLFIHLYVQVFDVYIRTTLRSLLMLREGGLVRVCTRCSQRSFKVKHQSTM